MIKSQNSKRALKKDNLINDFYDDWSIVKTCDTVTLESSHPLKLQKSEYNIQRMFYTHECKDDEIAYFKVDVNLIEISVDSLLGNI